VTVTISFERPAELMSMNDRRHWSKQRRQARAWRAAACYAALDQLPVLHRLQPASTVQVIIPVHGNHRRDPHNYFPVVKHVIDGLVDAGLWPDDTPEWVTTTEPVLTVVPRQIDTVKVHIEQRATR
jgi:crossover junction endodeoxyribonuclease RusA